MYNAFRISNHSWPQFGTCPETFITPAQITGLRNHQIKKANNAPTNGKLHAWGTLGKCEQDSLQSRLCTATFYTRRKEIYILIFQDVPNDEQVLFSSRNFTTPCLWTTCFYILYSFYLDIGFEFLVKENRMLCLWLHV